eukprot:8005462-Alexandrium_andersonii.AAC.1
MRRRQRGNWDLPARGDRVRSTPGRRAALGTGASPFRRLRAADVAWGEESSGCPHQGSERRAHRSPLG